MRVQRSIDIAASPEKIWPYMTEPDKILKWLTTFKEFMYTGEKRNCVGTTFYVEEKPGPTPLLKIYFVITEWIKNERIAFRMTAGGWAKDYEQSWTLRETVAGCRFTFIEDFEFPFGVVGRLIGTVGQFSSGASVNKMLNILKNLAEA